MEETIFENLNEEFYFSCNNKWDILRKLAKKINIDDELTEDSKQKADTGVQLLPRQDVLLFGMLPKMEQRVYSKCRECRLIFNPRDILKHKDCTTKLYEEIHPSLLKKQQKQLAKAKANSNKKPVPGTASASPPAQNPTLFKKPCTPPPIKPKSPIRPPAVSSPLSAPNPLLELKVSVAKVVLPKVTQITTVTSSTTSSTITMTTSSSENHHEIRVSSATSSTASKSSGHHSPKSLLKSTPHSTSHSNSSHRSSSSKDYHKSSRSTSSSAPDSHSSRNASKSSTGESHSSKSASKTIPMETQHHSPSKSSKSITSSDSSHSNTHSSRSASKGTPVDTHAQPKSSSHSDSHSSSRKSSSSSNTSTPMDTLPPPSRNSASTSSSSSHHHSSRHSTESSRSSSTNSSSSSSRHKKSKKSNTSSSTGSTSTSSSSKSIVFDPDAHCGVVEGTKGPCTRSVTCSNHRIQLRKLVPGRSKDIHQLIAERKAAKEKDPKHTSCSYTAPNAEARDSAGQNTSYVVIMAKLVSTVGNAESPATVTTTYVPIMPKVPVGMHTRPLTTSKMSEPIEKEADSPRTIVNGYINQTTFDTSPQDVYMPMSPISIASPVQFVKIGNKMMCLETPQSAKTPTITKNSPIFIQMPTNQPTPNIRTYKSHPKPARILTYGTRKMGGAILFSNRRLEGQRNAFLTKLRPHMNKTVNKRPASDKLITTDSKKLVSEMNGFFLHVDMSDASDSPQSNNLIQDKILLSIK